MLRQLNSSRSETKTLAGPVRWVTMLGVGLFCAGIANVSWGQGSSQGGSGAAEANATAGKTTQREGKMEKATFGNGCFWCTEAVFERLKGVASATSGYSGGRVPNPTYEQVCTGQTGHAEVIQVEYDPEVVTYDQLLEVFFATHDPTTLNRQGPDVGTQYRSAIFFHSEAQKERALYVMRKLTEERVFNAPIVTEVTRFDVFYPAEAYHQDFFAMHPNHGYCKAQTMPKIKKLNKFFADLVKEEAKKK